MEKRDRLLKICERAFVPIKTAFQIELKRLGVNRELFAGARLFDAGKRRPQIVGNLTRDITLHGKHVGELPFVLLAPQLFVVANIDQLGADQHRVAALSQSTGQHRTHAQLLTHRKRINFAALVTKDRTARDDFQIWKLREVVDDGFG